VSTALFRAPAHADAEWVYKWTSIIRSGGSDDKPLPALRLLAMSIDAVPPTVLPRRRVLVVEDDPPDARQAALWLDGDGHGRCEATTVERLSAGFDRLTRESATDDRIPTHGITGGAGSLQKPFTPDVLARTVRELLDGGVRTGG
jgi:hypothetical protein